MATLTVYGSTSDNWVNKSDNDYTTAHDAATGSVQSASALSMRVRQDNSSGLDEISRAGIYFDTSALPDDAVISAGVITLHRSGGTATQAFNVTLVNGDDLADPMVAADYGDLLDDTTALANVVDTDVWTVLTTQDFTLTAGGRAKITVTGTTKFGIRSSRDINSDAPADGVDEEIFISSADETETAKKPKLVITYTTSPTVTTQTCQDVVGTTATGRGNITALGDSVTAHGHCWNTTTNPTTSDSSVDNGAASATGTFTSAITGLTAGTGYYTRAYATNSIGTSYGANVYFVASTSRAGYIWMEGSNFRGFDQNAVERKYIHTNDVDDTAVNGATTDPISSNWAFDHDAKTTGTHGVGSNTIASDAQALMFALCS